MVGGMIRRTLRARFRTVYWNQPGAVQGPVILAANHHCWHDGYLMYALVKRLGLISVLWAEEYAAFPLFGKIGALPYPVGDAGARAVTLRHSLEALAQGRSLCVFAEGVLHTPPDVWPVGRAVPWLSRKSGVPVLPLGFRVEMSMHERPEAWVCVGEPLPVGADEQSIGQAIEFCLEQTRRAGVDWPILVQGTLDVNERWDVRKVMARVRNRS